MGGFNGDEDYGSPGNIILASANSANVGIGSDTTPDYLLELHAVGTPIFALSDTDVAHGLTTLAQTDVFSYLTSLSTTDGGAQWTSISDTNATALSIKGVIGSIEPAVTTPAVKIIGAKSNGTTGTADLAALETVFQVANNDNTAGFSVFGDGNVSIGTTDNLSAPLGVAGNIYADRVWAGSSSNRLAVFGDYFSPTNAYGLYSTVTGDDLIIADVTTDGLFRYGFDPVSAASILNISGTSVGIGTTAPDAKLHVVSGDIYVAPDIGYTVNYASADEDLYVYSNLEVDGSSYLATGYLANFYLGGVQVTSTAAELNRLDGSTVTTGGVMFGNGTYITQDATKLYWNDADKRLGIGNASPATTLEVTSVIKSTPTDAPGTCDANSEGGMYYDNSMNEPCFCDAANWVQFDGGGNCT